jgi:hypothetical protein
VRWVDQVLETALERIPTPIEEKPVDESAKAATDKPEVINPVTTH